MRGMELPDLDRWLAAHHGVISRAEAARLGTSTAAWYRAIEGGRLELVHPGVARAYGSPNTAELRIRAAVLAVGNAGIASHRSAAHLWGIERPDADPVDVIVPRSCRRRPAGIVVHRPTDVADLNVVIRSTIPCTNLLRTIVDLGAVDRAGVSGAVEAAIVSGVVSPAALRSLLARHARPGRSGVGSLRTALDRWPVEGKPPDSLLEVAMARLLDRYGLPAAELHPSIAGLVPDFRITGTPILIECDGWEFHGVSRSQFERDRERDLRFGESGYVVVHLTWRQITRQAARTAARLRELVRKWAPHALMAS